MNIATLSQAERLPSLRRAWSLFWRCASPLVRWSTLAAFAPFAAIDLAHGHAPKCYLFAMLLWWIWVPRLALLQRDAHAERLPFVSGDFVLALSIALVPLLAGFVQRPDLEIFAAFVAICAAGVVFLLSSLSRLRWLMLALLLWQSGDPLCDMLFGVAPVRQGFVAAFDLIGRPAWYALLAALALTAAAWSWRALSRSPLDRADTMMHTPLILLSRVRVENTDTADAFLTGLSFGLFAGTRKTRIDAPVKTPAQTMRAWLGAPFLPHVRPSYAVSAVSVLFFIGVLVEQARGGISKMDARAIDAVAILVLLAMFVPYLVRLQRLMRAPSGELAEMALLPGWGDGNAAKRAFSRAIWRPLLAHGLVTLGVLGCLLLVQWQAQRLSSDMALALLIVVCEVMAAMALVAFATLAGYRMTVWMHILIAVAIGVFVTTTLLLFAGVGNAFMRGVQTGIVLYLSPLALAVVPILRRYRRRAHPFLSA
ncbi:MAG: hypothetical protein ABL934_11295 [Lysobacteraceae bacterium]